MTLTPRNGTTVSVFEAVTMTCTVTWINSQQIITWKGANISPSEGITQTETGYEIDQGIFEKAENANTQISTLTISAGELRQCSDIVELECSLAITGHSYKDGGLLIVNHPSKISISNGFIFAVLPIISRLTAGKQRNRYSFR